MSASNNSSFILSDLETMKRLRFSAAMQQTVCCVFSACLTGNYLLFLDYRSLCTFKIVRSIVVNCCYCYIFGVFYFYFIYIYIYLHRENICLFKKKKKNVYSTRCSQAVTHPSTDRARRCLTSVIGREPVLSTWYGRRQQLIENKGINV